MSNFTDTFITTLQNVTNTNVVESSGGITGGIMLVIDKISDVLINTGTNYGFWKFVIILFALVGFFAVLSSVGGKILDGFKVIFSLFVVLPLIIITGIINKKKRKKRLSEWGEIKQDFKNNSKKIKKRYWVLWILTRIILPLVLIGGLIWLQISLF